MKTLRCAIYTRKSSEEGLDQAFNSLHAQREACEAYVLSQAGEGWTALADIYDDGGFSGGNMDRPALKRLLAAIKAKQVDVVVVYKVDRLTRSLGDFARIVETFDAEGVSFVSVTQAFNTTSSMGRLTLNVLLSFAQFEREVTGERIRDKILASKQKGMWMGGSLPLGYDVPTDLTTRALVINPVEADLVRHIFQRYLDLGSAHALVRELAGAGVVTKISVSKRGTVRGGIPFNRGSLFHLLKNPTYIGEIPHKERSYPGAHPPIIDRQIFDAVQAALGSSAVIHRKRRAAGAGRCPLKGILFDAVGVVMSPVSNQNRSGQAYRYYVSSSILKGQANAATDETLRRVSAGPLEAMVGERIGRLCPGMTPFPNGIVTRVDAMPSSLVVSLRADGLPGHAVDATGAIAEVVRRAAPDERIWSEDDGSTIKLAIRVRAKLTGGRTEFLSVGGSGRLKARRDAGLIRGIRTAHQRLAAWRADDQSPLKLDTEYDRRLLRLAFLAPDIQRAILDGRQPVAMTLQALRATDLPISWEKQRSLLLG